MRKMPSSPVTPSTNGQRSAADPTQPAGNGGEADFEHVLAGNRRLQLDRRIERLQLAVIDDGDAIAELVGLVHVVRRQEDGQVALGLDLLAASPTPRPARHGIETRRRLVEKEDPRLVHQAARDLDTAPHAARQVLHLLVRHCVSSTASSSSAISCCAFGARNAVQLGEDDQVLLDAQLEVAGHRLRDDADRSAHAVGLVRDVEAVDARRAGGRRQQRREHPDERRLAGAVGPEQPEDLTVFDREADAVDGREVAELLDDLVDVDGGRHRRWQQHVRGHADREAPVGVVHAQGGPRTS